MVVGCQPYAPVTFTPRKYSWYSFLLEAESTPRPQWDREDFISMKNPMTLAGIDPATFRFVAQHFLYVIFTVYGRRQKKLYYNNNIKKRNESCHDTSNKFRGNK